MLRLHLYLPANQPAIGTRVAIIKAELKESVTKGTSERR